MGRQYRPPRVGGSAPISGGLVETLPRVTGATSASVQIPNYGFTDLTTYAAGDYVMDAPSRGVQKTLVWASSSSAAVIVRLSTGTAVKAGHTGATQITFGLTTVDGAVQLLGLNSTRWALVSMSVPSTLSGALSTVTGVTVTSS